MQQLLKFLGHLAEAGIGYLIESSEDAVVVLVRTQAGLYEIAFFTDGAIEVQTFEPDDADGERVTLNELISAPEFNT